MHIALYSHDSCNNSHVNIIYVMYIIDITNVIQVYLYTYTYAVCKAEVFK